MEEIDIWRAARVVIEMCGEGAEFAAARRAYKALDQGDAFNFHLWRQVTEAIRELKQPKPDDGQSLN